DRNATTPFLLKLFYRTGAFHRQFSFPANLPAHITVHTWPTATLTELTHLLVSHSPHLLPAPSIGTRLVYRLFYHDTRSGGGPLSNFAPRLASLDLGSVVIGDEGNAGTAAPAPATTTTAAAAAAAAIDAFSTLADTRFVVGDFVSVAILPPSAVDGSVQAAAAARTGRGYGAGQASRGFLYARGRGLDSRMGGGGPGGGGGMYGGSAVPPVGEWRRGERLPDVPAPSGRSRGRR
ncbi:hypothetical protein M406DRAFT_233654, partial [Cryphonectria parasitica EP155]